jgi:hypothetical protein
MKRGLSLLSAISAILGVIKSIGELNTTLPAFVGVILPVVTKVGEFTWAIIVAAILLLIPIAIVNALGARFFSIKRWWLIWTAPAVMWGTYLFAMPNPNDTFSSYMIPFLRVLGVVNLLVLIGIATVFCVTKMRDSEGPT